MKKQQDGAVLAGIACAAALVFGWVAWPSPNVASAQKGGKDGPQASPEQVKAIETWTNSLALQAATGSPAASPKDSPGAAPGRITTL